MRGNNQVPGSHGDDPVGFQALGRRLLVEQGEPSLAEIVSKGERMRAASVVRGKMLLTAVVVVLLSLVAAGLNSALGRSSPTERTLRAAEEKHAEPVRSSVITTDPILTNISQRWRATARPGTPERCFVAEGLVIESRFSLQPSGAPTRSVIPVAVDALPVSRVVLAGALDLYEGPKIRSVVYAAYTDRPDAVRIEFRNRGSLVASATVNDGWGVAIVDPDVDQTGEVSAKSLTLTALSSDGHPLALVSGSGLDEQRSAACFN